MRYERIRKMKCLNCGAELSEDTKFCSYCGSNVEEPVPPPIYDKPKESASTTGAHSNGTSYSKIRERLSKVYSIKNDEVTLAKLWKSHKKAVVISLIAFVLLLCVIGVQTKRSLTVSAPYGAVECTGKEYSEIEDLFRTAGFKNITMEKLYDLRITDTDKVNTVESVSIDGSADFIQNQNFSSYSSVVVRCHTFENFDVKIIFDFKSNLLFNKYNIKFFMDDEEIATLTHGENADFEFQVEGGDHTITLRNAESSSVKETLDLSVICDMEIAYKISCSGDKITLETLYIDKKVESSDNVAKISVPASEYKQKNYQEVSEDLKLLGFTNIEYEVLYDIVFGITDEGEVESVSISGNKDFSIDDVFPKDASVVITYHMKKSNDPNGATESTSSHSETSASSEEGSSESVSYSTNNKDTVKKGNVGAYSYKSIGGTYDIYWVIDFDDGYVYYFTDGNGSETCDKVKIDSGDLNDYVTITYHDGGSVWQEYLHFKRKNQPDILIVQDADGSDTQYNPTNLDKAIALRDSKRIIDY